jgi:hypothetical protein
MSEKIPYQTRPEERAREEQVEWWMQKQYRAVEAPLTSLRESGPDIAALEQLIAAFESTYSLEDLHAIVELTLEDALNHPIWGPAMRDLIPIVEKLNTIRVETDVSTDDYVQLKNKYLRLSSAVGIIRDNEVEHR